MQLRSSREHAEKLTETPIGNKPRKNSVSTAANAITTPLGDCNMRGYNGVLNYQAPRRTLAANKEKDN